MESFLRVVTAAVDACDAPNQLKYCQDEPELSVLEDAVLLAQAGSANWKNVMLLNQTKIGNCAIESS